MQSTHGARRNKGKEKGRGYPAGYWNNPGNGSAWRAADDPNAAQDGCIDREKGDEDRKQKKGRCQKRR